MASWIEEDDAFIPSIPAPKVDPLKGAADYERWVNQMHIALSCLGLYSIVTGNAEEPVPPASAALLSSREPTLDDAEGSSKALTILGAQSTAYDLIEADRQYKRALRKFRAQNERAWAFIMTNISEPLGVHIREVMNAHAAWNKLEEVFGGTSQLKVQMAWANLTRLNYNQCTSLSEYCGIHRSYMMFLEKASKHELPKILWVCSLIEGLKGSYSSHLEHLQHKARDTGEFIDYEELVRFLHIIERSKVKDPGRLAAKRPGNLSK